MGLHRFKPLPSGRMGILWTLASIRGASLVEYGCMGHMRYGSLALTKAGVLDGCKLYSTHIEETDIALGITTKLNHTIANVVKRDHPRVIFLQPSSVPQVIGTDMPALVKELQPEYPDVLLLPFGHGGFDVTQHRGVQEALLTLVKALPIDSKRTNDSTFNLIGSCADLFHFQADASEILRILEGAFSLKPVCVLSSETSIAEIEKMGSAHINIVIRREGEAAAMYLQQRFGTSYVSGRPYGIEGTTTWIKEIARITGLTVNADFLRAEQETARKLLSNIKPAGRRGGRSHSGRAALCLGGHSDIVKGILAFGCGELSIPRGTCWCDCPDMGTEEIPYFSEEEWIQAIHTNKKELLMASGEALESVGCNTDMQISNPDSKWRLYPWEPPFVGFHGAVYLANLWANHVIDRSVELQED